MRDYWDNLRLFNRNIRFFLLATAVQGFVFFGIYTLLLNLYLLRLGYGPEFIGLVNGVGPLMLAISSLPAGIVSRRLGSRRTLLLSYLFMAIFFGLTPLSEFVPEAMRQSWIVVLYASAWTAGAFGVVNFGPYIMAFTGEKERSYAFALQAASFPVAGFLGNLVGGALPNFFARLADTTIDSPIPFRNALLLAAVIELLAVLATKQTAEVDLTTGSSSNQSGIKSSPPYRLMLLFGIITLSAVAGEWTIRVYFNVYLDQVLAASPSVIGAVSAGAQLMGLAAFFSPQAAARFGRNRVILLGLLAIVVGYIPLIAIGHWAAVGLSYMVIIAAASLYNPIYLAYSQSLVDPEWRTTIASAITLAFGLGIALTSLNGGEIITTYNYRTLFIIGALAPLVGGFIFWWSFRPQKAPTPELPMEHVE